MKGLLIKDFKLLKGQKNFFMTITAISIIMIIVSPGTSFPIGFLGFVGALFSLSSISYDEFDNGNAFLFSLPITRKDYVLEKYIFGLISGIMFLLLGTVISLVVIGITKTGSFNEIFLTAGSLFPTILLILSIMLPFILKFGGEKGRIAIIGVINEPKLILADEPTGALDSKSSRLLLETMSDINKKMQATILMVTHDPFSASFCERILFLKDGKIFNEIFRGEKSRKDFFNEILDILTLLGGEVGNVR